MRIHNKAIVIDVDVLHCFYIQDRSVLSIFILGVRLLLTGTLGPSLGWLALARLWLLSSVLLVVLLVQIHLGISSLVALLGLWATWIA